MYAIRESEDGKTVFVIETLSLNEVGVCQSLSQGLNIIESLFEDYDKEKERFDAAQKYQGLLSCLEQMMSIFSYNIPMFSTEEYEEGENLLAKIQEVIFRLEDLCEELQKRVSWYTEKEPRPFCFEMTEYQDVTTVYIQISERIAICTQTVEDSKSFLEQALKEKNITETEYHKLEQQICEIFFHISPN